LREVLRRCRDDRLWDASAALAFFAILALAPFALLLASFATFFVSAREAGALLQAIGRDVAPDAVTAIVGRRVAALDGMSHGALIGWGATVGLVAGANATAAAGRALDAVYHATARRSPWQVLRVALPCAAVTGILLLVAVGLVVGVPRIASPSATAPQLWARYPASSAVMMVAWATLYRFLPAERRPFHLLTAGSTLGVAVWLLGSYGLSFYLAHAPALRIAYGGLLRGVALLAWLWVASLAFLLGAVLDAALHGDHR
jgi:membrane protein